MYVSYFHPVKAETSDGICVTWRNCML